MLDAHDTTEEHPPRDATTVNGPTDSFVPDKRVIDKGGRRSPPRRAGCLQQRLRAASLVLVFGFGLFFRPIAGPALAPARIADRPVPRDHARPAALESGALSPAVGGRRSASSRRSR